MAGDQHLPWLRKAQGPPGRACTHQGSPLCQSAPLHGTQPSRRWVPPARRVPHRPSAATLGVPQAGNTDQGNNEPWSDATMPCIQRGSQLCPHSGVQPV